MISTVVFIALIVLVLYGSSQGWFMSVVYLNQSTTNYQQTPNPNPTPNPTPPAPVGSCSDTDVNDWTTRGTCTDSVGSYTDSCFSDFNPIEYSCDSTTKRCVPAQKQCIENNLCYQGECWSQIDDADNDCYSNYEEIKAGRDPYVSNPMKNVFDCQLIGAKREYQSVTLTAKTLFECSRIANEQCHLVLNPRYDMCSTCCMWSC